MEMVSGQYRFIPQTLMQPTIILEKISKQPKIYSELIKTSIIFIGFFRKKSQIRCRFLMCPIYRYDDDDKLL